MDDGHDVSPRKRLAAVKWAVVLLILVLDVRAVHATDDVLSRATLEGLPGVFLLVEGFDEEDRRAGFNRETFQADAEVKLRRAGIRVLTQAEGLATPGKPTLDIVITPLAPNRSGMMAFSITISLRQRVRLQRNEEMALASTWSVRFNGNGELPFIRSWFRDAVDKFISAWLSVNPR